MNTSDDNSDNNTEEGQLTEEELEDPPTKYDLFGDDAYDSCDEIIDDEPQDQSNSNNNLKFPLSISLNKTSKIS
jgi:hypothetical protein